MDANGPHRPNPRLRLLMVEDDPVLGRLIEMVLGRYTDDVLAVRSGNAAIRALGERHFDAMACDISLPDMSGLDVIARVRGMAPGIGIVAITGMVDVEVAVQSMKAGADDFLGKPFDPEILWHMLNRAADNRARLLEAEQAAAYRKLAYTDALTGSPNRRYLDEFLEEAVSASRHGGHPLVVAYFDIDNFKLLNDFVGHEQGDLVLQQVSETLRRLVSEPAIFGRFGGDEFVAIFPGASAQEARGVVDEVRRAVADFSVTNGAQVTLPTRISCGLAVFRGDESPRSLVAEAEDQMYLDKSLSPSLLALAADSGGAPDAHAKVANLKALRSLVKAIDRRDSYTRFHSDHATHMALQMARRLGLPAESVNAITLAGPIHDLGKIVVPDEILRKPGPLSVEERRNMEEHPVMGAAITAAVMDYGTVVDLVRHHHERWDGHGYPGGLARESILLATRIFTLADAFSAMTTDRPYRKGLSHDEAIDQIMKGSGTQFDPDLGREFVAMIERQARREGAAA